MKDSGIFNLQPAEEVVTEERHSSASAEYAEKIESGNSSSNDHPDAVAAFCSITGSDTDAACHYLEVCVLMCYE